MADPVVAPVVPPVVPPPTGLWYEGKLDAETIGHIENKGWKKEDAIEVAVNAVKAHREAEKKLGIPSDELMRFPKNPSADSDGMKPIWQKLGTPADMKDYDFPALKDKDGKVTNADLDTALRTAALKVNMPKDMATEMAAVFVKAQHDVTEARNAEIAANLKTEQETLAKNWGIHAPANKVIAQNAAAALGMTKAEVDALESVIGYARTMETLRNIGTKIGEAQFVRPGGPGGNDIVSREQAQARIKELVSDPIWSKAYREGDKAKLREMTNLTKIAVGDDIEGQF